MPATRCLLAVVPIVAALMILTATPAVAAPDQPAQYVDWDPVTGTTTGYPGSWVRIAAMDMTLVDGPDSTIAIAEFSVRLAGASFDVFDVVDFRYAVDLNGDDVIEPAERGVYGHTDWTGQGTILARWSGFDGDFVLEEDVRQRLIIEGRFRADMVIPDGDPQATGQIEVVTAVDQQESRFVNSYTVRPVAVASMTLRDDAPTTVAPGARDAVAGVIDVIAAEVDDVTLMSLDLQRLAGDPTHYLAVRIWTDGDRDGTPGNGPDDGELLVLDTVPLDDALQLDLPGGLVLPPAEPRTLIVTVDVADGAGEGALLQLAIAGGEALVGEAPFAVSGAPLNLRAMTVQRPRFPELRASAEATFDRTVLAGSRDVPMLPVELEAVDAGVTVTEIAVEVVGDPDWGVAPRMVIDRNGNGEVDGVDVPGGDVAIPGTVGVPGQWTFTPESLTLAAGGRVNLLVAGHVAEDAPVNAGWHARVTAIATADAPVTGLPLASATLWVGELPGGDGRDPNGVGNELDDLLVLSPSGAGCNVAAGGSPLLAGALAVLMALIAVRRRDSQAVVRC